MRVLLDTNVVLDVLLNRHPWVVEAAVVWKAHDEDQITGYLAASSLTDIFYIARRLTDLDTARRTVKLCLDTFEICPVNRQALEQAYSLPGNDFEDNLQIACAEMMGLDAIVTRDTSGFKVTPPLLALTPNELIRQLHLP